ncbi:MAG: PKD domain-containing protein, partial [Bacteroidota bacterium]
GLVLGWLDCNSLPQFAALTNITPLNVYDISICGNNQANCNAFFAASNSAFNPLNYTFQAFQAGKNYAWDFGDGNTGTNQFELHSYAQADTYTVCLIVSDSFCADTFCQTVFVGVAPPQPCDASFFGTDIPGTNTAIFDPVVTSYASYLWDFGDGNFDTSIVATHVYAQPDTYNVCLIIDNGQGCQDTNCQTIVVSGTNSSSCQASFSVADSGLTQVFSDQSSFTGNPDYFWDFGDGNISTSQNPAHTYAQAGVYVVCLTISDSANNCYDQFCGPVFVNGGGNTNCDASFFVFPDSLGGLSPYFCAQIPGYQSYNWDFGDGNTGTGFAPSHTYAVADTYTVCLIIDDGQGCMDTSCQTIFVDPSSSSCQASFFTTSNGLDVVFNNTTPPTAGSTFMWDFGDGNTSTQMSPTHSYAQSGTYVACLTVGDSTTNCFDTHCQVITLGNNQPGCSALFFGFPDSLSGLSATFFALDSSYANYFWDFGDGNTGSGWNPTHTYAQPDTYTVCLVVDDGNGCIDSLCQVLPIGIVPPLPCDANFGFLSLGGNLLDFFAYSPAVSYSWDFGDGNTGSGPSVQHTYAQAGTYNVCLITDNGQGCLDTLCQTVVTNVVLPPPGFPIFGQVLANGNPVDDFTAFLIVYDSVQGTLAAVDTFASDSMNGFFFFDAPNGNYFVKAALNSGDPDFANFLPTYYGDELFWYDATEVNQNSFPFLGINLVPGTNPGGPGFIGGLVSQGANKTEGDPIVGMHILVTDMNDLPVAYGLTDTDGAFSISNLPYGTYKVWAEMWGRSLDHYVVTLGANDPAAEDLAFEVGTDAVTALNATGLDDILGANGVSLFPNPAREQFTLRLDLKTAADLTLDLQNMMGQSVSIKNIDAFQGRNEVNWNVSELSKGVYFLRISNETAQMDPVKVIIR